MTPDQVLSQFQATGVQTCFHNRHINPPALSLSKGCPVLRAMREARRKERSFDKLRTDGF